MASNISICGICDLRHLSNPSTHWCQDCDEALCSECKEHHTLLKATRGHTTIPIDDYQQLPSFITDIKHYCDIHNDKYQNYCQKHECPLCCKCIQDHAKCTENIVHIETVIKHAKTSQTFQDLNQCVSNLQSNITRMKAAREDNLAKVADQCKSAVKKIREFRIKLNHHLDVVEDLIIKLQDAESKSSQQIKEVIKSLNEAESEISNFDNILQGIKQHASELQVYLATREIEKQVSNKETRLTSLMENKRFDDFTVSLEIDTNIANILSDVKVFGTVSMQTVPTNYKLINVKSRQAQIITTVVKSFDDIKLKLVNMFDSGSSQVTGCIILPDRRMAFTEYGHMRLSIRKADGSPDFEIPLKESTAFNLTLVKDATVAVSCGNLSGNTTCIQIIDLKSREITKILNTTNIAYGIACVDELLVYCGYKPNGIYAFDVKTEQQTKISSTIDVGIMSYITYFKNKFYVTDGTNHTVTSFDNKGNIIWAYKNDVNMRTPRGISVDNSGNVFVASAGSTNVTIISPDGNRAKQIVDQNNKFDTPCALHYDRSTNQLLVANLYGTVLLFNVE